MKLVRGDEEPVTKRVIYMQTIRLVPIDDQTPEPPVDSNAVVNVNDVVARLKGYEMP